MDSSLIIFLSTILLVAAMIDFNTQKIPNLLTYPSMLAALMFHGITNGGDGLLFSGGGLVLGTLIFIIPYLLGGMGAGDAKLMGAVGAALGPKGVFIASLLTGLTGGIYAIALILLHWQACRHFVFRTATTLKTFAMTRQFIPIPAPENEKKPRLCYGIAIAVGTWLYMGLTISGYRFFN
jgi:prepilin peptidase CpaA